jgi:hypothetical protein
LIRLPIAHVLAYSGGLPHQHIVLRLAVVQAEQGQMDTSLLAYLESGIMRIDSRSYLWKEESLKTSIILMEIRITIGG